MSGHDDAQLSFLPPVGKPVGGRAPSGVVRVLTWNVQHANAARTRRQSAWLVADQPDVLVLTEVAAGRTGDMMAEWLRQSGYTVRLPPPADQDRYRVLLAVESGVIDPVDIVPANFANRCAAAHLKLAQGECGVVGLYVPSRGPKERRNVAKRAFQEAVAAALPQVAPAIAADLVVIAGDLNVVEPGHQPHYPVFGTWEYDFYRSFAEHGYADAFRSRHPDAVAHSWFGRPAADGSRNGYRFDHLFLSEAHRGRIEDCRYRHEPREIGLSDHSAMELTIRL